MALEIFQTVSISAQRLSRLPSAVICTLKNSKRVGTLLALQADFLSYLIVCLFVLGFWLFGCIAYLYQENRLTSSSFPKMALEIFQTVSISAQRLSRLPSAVICTLKNSKHVGTLLGLQADYF